MASRMPASLAPFLIERLPSAAARSSIPTWLHRGRAREKSKESAVGSWESIDYKSPAGERSALPPSRGLTGLLSRSGLPHAP